MAFRACSALFSSALITRSFKYKPKLNLISLAVKFSVGISIVRSVSSFLVPSVKMQSFSFINAELAKEIDIRLMDKPGFSIDQLMELAGYSVATATHDYINTVIGNSNKKGVLIFCGPGNNGGDGLVAARHLKHFGYHPTVIYPKPGKSNFELFLNLVQQCQDLSIPVLSTFEKVEIKNLIPSTCVIVDSLFGFSFDGAPREPFASMIQYFKDSTLPVISVDIPSGWNVDEGDVYATGFTPHCVVSLTLPKKCMEGYKGVHYIGGRFVPSKLATEMKITLPDYGFGPNQIVRVSSEADTKQCTESDNQVSVMFATAASTEQARSIGRALLSKKLIACVNMIPQVTSMYEWEGVLEESTEILMMIKTTKGNVDAVTAEIKALHSYTVPESIALSVVGGNKDYLDWVSASVNGVGKSEK